MHLLLKVSQSDLSRYYSLLKSTVILWDFKFSRQWVWCSELSSGIYCRVKWSSAIILHGSMSQKTNSEHHTAIFVETLWCDIWGMVWHKMLPFRPALSLRKHKTVTSKSTNSYLDLCTLACYLHWSGPSWPCWCGPWAVSSCLAALWEFVPCLRKCPAAFCLLPLPAPPVMR
jgi:hypothetical protein